MSCPNCKPAANVFDRGFAESDLKDYRRNGPGKTTRWLIEALGGVEHATVLDIGGGVGAIQHELLKRGADRAIHVEASPAYLDAAKDEARRQGHADRITYYEGDFVQLAPQIPQADMVTLEKVICCYPDMHALVGLSAARARKLYGVVFPRDTWWMKIGGRISNVFMRLTRSSFRVFVHPTEEIEAIVQANGLQRRYYRKTLIWQVIVYARAQGA